MGEKTGKIAYNLKDRGYKAFGSPRNFNIPLVNSMINSAACQEAIKARTLVGFYGHWPRVKFGAVAAEGGMDGKTQVNVEPAVVTVFAKAYQDGTIEHEQEFLDTDAGEKARKAYSSRVGGFSSVINEPKRYFGGMDYVFAPNYMGNRGFTLDSAYEQAHDALYDCLLDDAHAQRLSLQDIDRYIALEHQMALEVSLDNAHAERMRFNHMIEERDAQIEELLSLLAKRDPKLATQYDSATAGAFQGRGVMFYDSATADMLQAQTDAFMHAELLQPQELAKEKESPVRTTISRATDFARAVLLG